MVLIVSTFVYSFLNYSKFENMRQYFLTALNKAAISDKTYVCESRRWLKQLDFFVYFYNIKSRKFSTFLVQVHLVKNIGCSK